eukprot:g6744.t1
MLLSLRAVPVAPGAGAASGRLGVCGALARPLGPSVATRAPSQTPYLGLFLRRSPDQDVGTNKTTGPKAADEEIVTATTDLYEIQVTGHRRITLKQIESFGPPLVTNVIHWSKNAFNSGSPSSEQMSGAGGGAAVEREQTESRALIQETIKLIQDIFRLNPQFREFLEFAMQSPTFKTDHQNPGRLADFASAMTSGSVEETYEVFREANGVKRLQLAYKLLQKELQIIEAQVKIRSQVEETVQKQQKEFYLREQMKVIKKELGMEKDDKETLLEKFRARLGVHPEGKIPAEIREVVEGEMEKLSVLDKNSSEFQQSEENFSLKKAKGILDRDHYGLVDVKERILEFIGVGKLKGSVQGKIICLVGPPGTGKTSIGKSIAESLNREFYRFSVGGLHDVAEIKGHRRTYIGAMPGKLIQCLKQTKVNNPLILIDEIDKLGRGGSHGDPASALLEVLDPSQNASFVDHFLDVPVDFSQVLFLCTANVLDTIPEPLLDRMEVVRLSGYDLPEKTRIAQDYLIPKVMRETGLLPELVREKKKEEAVAGAAEMEKQSTVDESKTATSSSASSDEQVVESSSSAAGEVEQEAEAPDATVASGGADAVEKASSTEAASGPPAPLVDGVHGSSRPAAESIDGAPTASPPAAPTAYEDKDFIKDDAVDSMIRWYCREAGVRNLQKQIEKLCRKRAFQRAEQLGETEPTIEVSKEGDIAITPAGEAGSAGGLGGTRGAGGKAEATESDEKINGTEFPAGTKALPPITKENLSDYLGKPLYTSDKLYEQPPAGVVMGLAWTALGGSTLYIETKAIPVDTEAGRGSLNVTGRLGETMQESSKISLVVAKKFHPAVIDFTRRHDVYLHVPEGATPKDGPSAGVTMTTALISLALDQPVVPNVAMTGEVSLTGMVLPVGGIKEKTIAARRSGCKLLIFPDGNKRDVDALPEYLKEDIEIKYAKYYEDVWRVAFGEAELPLKGAPAGSSSSSRTVGAVESPSACGAAVAAPGEVEGERERETLGGTNVVVPDRGPPDARPAAEQAAREDVEGETDGGGEKVRALENAFGATASAQRK